MYLLVVASLMEMNPHRQLSTNWKNSSWLKHSVVSSSTLWSKWKKPTKLYINKINQLLQSLSHIFSSLIQDGKVCYYYCKPFCVSYGTEHSLPLRIRWLCATAAGSHHKLQLLSVCVNIWKPLLLFRLSESLCGEGCWPYIANLLCVECGTAMCRQASRCLLARDRCWIMTSQVRCRMCHAP